MRWCLLFSVWLVPNVLSKGGRFIHRLLINLILKKYLCKAFHNCFFPSLLYISNCYFVTGVTPSKVWFDHLIYLFTEVLLNLIWCARAHTHTHTTLPLVEELVKWTKLEQFQLPQVKVVYSVKACNQFCDQVFFFFCRRKIILIWLQR